MIIGHGGNIYDTARHLGCSPFDIIDMSSNVNPFGPLPGMMAHISEHLKCITALPDAAASMVSNQFASAFQIDSCRVLAGNGSTQFIYSLPLALKIRKALIVGPTYADYADACEMHSVSYDYIIGAEDNHFKPNIDKITEHAKSYDAVFICNPNNPTGSLISMGNLNRLCESNPITWFIIDESYLPFVLDGEKFSMIHTRLRNVIVLNSMSKIFRVPGLRVGLLIAHEKAIRKISRYMLPWSVNSVAQAAAIYLMSHPEEVDGFIFHTQKGINGEQDHMTNMLNKQEYLRLFPSATNFILARVLGDLTAKIVCSELIKDRILIRDCSNFKGLSDRFIRISLKTTEINNILIEKLSALSR